MNNRTWTILLSIGLLACFFLPALGNTSGYDTLTKMPGGIDNWDKYIWLLIPISALMLLIGAINNNKYFLGRGLWAWLPLLTVIFILVRVTMGSELKFDMKIFLEVVKHFRVGFWVMTGISLLLAFVTPKN